MMKRIKPISRAKFENIAYLTMNMANVTTYLLLFSAFVIKAKDGTLADIIQAIYCTILNFLLILHELTMPAWFQIYFGFLSTHRGKGFFFLFMGCLVMCHHPFNVIISILAFLLGFSYIIISLISSLPPPNAFVVHWQNNKDFWAEGLDLNPPPLESPNMVPILHPSAWHPPTSKAIITPSSALTSTADLRHY